MKEDDKEVPPGTWREELNPGEIVIDGKVTKGELIAPESPKLEYVNDLIALYQVFQVEYHNPRSVLYPSCGFDASPSKVFDNVTYVDIEHGNKGCIETLKKAGLKAIKGDIRDYKPTEEHDLLILQKPVIPPEWATQHLMPGGYVIANDYHQTATKLRERSDEFLQNWDVSFSSKRVSFNGQNIEGLCEQSDGKYYIFRKRERK